MSWSPVEKGIRKWTAQDGSVTYHVAIQRIGRDARGRADSLKEARQLRSKLELDLYNAEHFPERAEKKVKRIRVSDFMEKYVEEHLRLSAPKSASKEKGRLKRIKERFGRRWVDAITMREIEAFLRGLRVEGLSEGTYNRYRARLSSMMSKAVDWGHREDNPVSRIKTLKEKPLTNRFLESEEYQALLDVCDPQMRRMVIFAANTGMRQGEQLTLRWEDIDLNQGYVTVRSEVSKTSEGRTVPINRNVREVLMEIGPEPGGLVFGLNEFPKDKWNKIRKKLGWDKTENPRLAGWRWHDLRHHCASWMVMKDVSLMKVSRILGHKSLQTTQRYAHLADRSLKDAVEQLTEFGQ